jgi:aminoglycoside phosphotransferase (APT) family kinase protein
MGRADVYLHPHAPDPVLSDDVVLTLVRRHCASARMVTAVDESGGEARAYVVDDTVVLKTQRPHRLRPRTSLAKEAYLLDLLAPRLGNRIPALLGYGQADTDLGSVEYLCMTRVEGRAIHTATVTGDARRALMRELAEVLRALHATPVAADRIPADRDVAALRRRLENGFADVLAPAVTARLPVDLPDLPDLIDRALSSLPTTLASVVLHSNPGPTHVFVDPGTGRFTGLIDFGDSYASHPALDLHRWPDPADRLLLRDCYVAAGPTDPDFDRMWTVAMVHADLAAVGSGSVHAEAAAADLADRSRLLPSNRPQ